MPPISLGTGRSNLALETGRAKLWILLIGVNEYQDQNLPRLHYPAFDCQGLGESLIEATQAFPQKEIKIHHDFVEPQPMLKAVQESLDWIVTSAQTQDTILFYFSGHGLLDPQSQQTVLCLRDTNRDDLLGTGLNLQTLLAKLSRCLAHCQVVWLDACHCGNMTLTGAKGSIQEQVWDDPTTQLLDALRQRAAKSKGFYALLSCDQGQKSWEFPDLGHGVFSYFLMRGLRGEAADAKGLIKADGLYQYVYNQTLKYIEKVNQQLRLINQQKRHRGEPHLHSEYSVQTPKRIVEGVGELILGLKSSRLSRDAQRHALIVEGLGENQTSQALSEVFQQEGHFSVTLLSTTDQQALDIHKGIQAFLQCPTLADENSATFYSSGTLLLYLRGRIEVEAEGESYLVLQNGLKISRSWLRKELRRSKSAQQIVIIDGQGKGVIEEWIEELKLWSDHGQCLLGTISPEGEENLFAQVLLESLVATNPEVGLSGAEWLSLLQTNCEQLGITLSAWLSGTQGVIDILPGQIHWEMEEYFPTTAKVKPTRTKPSVSEVKEAFPAKTKVESASEKPSVSEVKEVFQESPSLSPEQYAKLLQFLTELIGPIAIELLNSALAQTKNTNDLIQDLSGYLSPHEKSVFEPWTRSMIDAETSSNASSVEDAVTQSREPCPQTKEAARDKISPEQYTQLESMLQDMIGPVAPMLLSKTAEQFENLELLIAGLKDYLTPAQRTEFENQIVSVFPQYEEQALAVSSGGDVLPPNSTAMKADETFIRRCEQALTQLIGPVAPFIIQSTLQDYPEISQNEFVDIIAKAIPNEDESTNFRQRMRYANP